MGTFYVCGWPGNVWYDSGSGWSQLTVPPTYSSWVFQCVWALNESFVIFGAHNFSAGSAELLKYDGNSWSTLVTSPFTTESNPIWHDIFGFSENNIYFVSSDGFGSGNGAVWNYNGSTITKVLNPTGVQFYNIHGYEANNVWAFGGDGLGSSYFYKYNGVSWSLKTTGVSADGGTSGGKNLEVTSDVTYFAGDDGIYSNDGLNWSLDYSIPSAGYFLTGFWQDGYSNMFAVGARDTSPGGYRAYVLYFDGTSWTDVSPFDSYNSGLFSVARGGDDLVACGTAGTILRYDGSTWYDESISVGFSTTLQDIAFAQGQGPPPFVDGYSPSGGSTAPTDVLITISISDSDENIIPETIDAYVEGNWAYSGEAGLFISPYDGPSSNFTTGTSLDGYDAHNIIIDKTINYSYNSNVTVQILAEDADGNLLDDSWSFTTVTFSLPFVEQQIPPDGDAVQPLDQRIDFLITDANYNIDYSSIRVYIEGALAFRGDTDSFILPYDGYLLSATSIDGYDAYHVFVSNTGDWDYKQTVNVRAVADNIYGLSVDDSWSFTTISAPPFLEAYDPGVGATGVPVSTTISVLIVDPDGYILPKTIDAYVDGVLAYDGYTDTFYAPFTGTTPVFLPGGSAGEYDAYQIILNRSSNFDYEDTISVQINVDSYGGLSTVPPYWGGFTWGDFEWLVGEDDYSSLSESWSFTTTVFDTVGPVVLNKFPAPGSSGISSNTLVSFDVVDSKTTVIPSTISVTIGGTLAFSSNTFLNPFAGPSSEINPTSIGGADGYNLVIDNTGSYSALVPISVYAEDAYGNSVNSVWTFQSGERINVLYFSNGYGLKAIDVSSLAGESQSQVRSLLTTSTSPAISSNNIQFIHGNRVDGYNYLALSFGADEYVGVDIIAQASSVNTYLDGYRAAKAHLTQDGTLYAINVDQNQVEVYYGANFRSGVGRTPDYVYNTTSTPPLFHGDILDLHVVDGRSNVLSGGTRFYVGTTLGATRVDTYDRNTDGYGDGYDSYGLSFTYSIAGGGATYEAIGGTVAKCTNVSSDDDNLVMIIGTDDDAENGGITQISLSGNRKILFMNREGGFIPSNTINDIFGKAY